MALADNVKFYEDLAALLRSWGWTPEFWPGWKTRTNGTPVTTPKALTVHHTGGKATATSYIAFPPDRPQLRVLANVHITAAHKIVIVAAGTASHGGYTHEPCYARVVQGTAPLDRDLVPGADSSTFSINRYTVGLEVDGAGGANEWDTWTKQAVTAFALACERVAGWSAAGGNPRIGAHKEHTRRKPGDPYMSMGRLRTVVRGYLAAGTAVRPPAAPVPPPPVVVPPPAPPALETDVAFRAGAYNAQLHRFGGGSYDLDAEFVDDVLRCSVLLGSEMDAYCRNAVRGKHGYLVYSFRTLGLFWEPDKYSHGDRVTLGLGAHTNGYHGLVGTMLRSKVNQQAFFAAAVHVRPNDAIPGSAAQKMAGKLADVGKIVAALKAYPRVVVGGDWSTASAHGILLKAGFTHVTPRVDTYDKVGVQPLDGIYVRGLAHRSGGLVVPTAASDHHGLVAQLTLPGSQPGSTL